MDKEINKTNVLDPERKNPFDSERNIFCHKCKKLMDAAVIEDSIIINAGISVDDTFFPEKRSYYYHKECYERKE